MNIKQVCGKILLPTAIIGILIAIIMSFYYDYYINGNFITILSAMWSALATAILGGIAYWQNKRYKELSDHYSQKIDSFMLTPECYLFNILLDNPQNGIPCMRAVTAPCGSVYYLEFFSLNIPMLNTTVKEITFVDVENPENKKMFLHEEIAFSIKKFPILTENDMFLIQIMVPKEFSKLETDCKLKLAYNNIYGATIEKDIWLVKDKNGNLKKVKIDPAIILGEI